MGRGQVCLQEPTGSRLLLGGHVSLGPLSLPEPQMWGPQHVDPASSPPEAASGPTCPQPGKTQPVPRCGIFTHPNHLTGRESAGFVFRDVCVL